MWNNKEQLYQKTTKKLFSLMSNLQTYYYFKLESEDCAYEFTGKGLNHS